MLLPTSLIRLKPKELTLAITEEARSNSNTYPLLGGMQSGTDTLEQRVWQFCTKANVI